MDLDTIFTSIAAILTGGTSGIVVLLLLCAGCLIWLYLQERKRTAKLETRVNDIVDKYYQNQQDAVQSMSKLAEVLNELRSEIRWKAK